MAHSVTNKLQATVILRGKDKAAINEDRGIVKGIQKEEKSEKLSSRHCMPCFLSLKPSNFSTSLALWGAHCSPKKLLLDVLRKDAN